MGYQAHETVLIAALAAWFALSVLGQVAAVRWRAPFLRPLEALRGLRKYDLFGLIPLWTFFAPRPAWTDFHLLYRDRLADGTLTPWTEVMAIEARRWWHFAWNPRKHERKAVIDVVRMLSRRLFSTDRASWSAAIVPLTDDKPWVEIPPGVHTSLPYLAILHMVSNLPRLGASDATQFLIMIADAARSGEPTVMMVSALHEL
jgi:hypothetical protein